MSLFVLASLAAAQAATAKPPAAAPPVIASPAPSASTPEAPSPVRTPVLAPSRGVVPTSVRAHATPRVPLQDLVTIDDYPAAALRERDQGTARFMLTVDTAGRVSGCVILVSTGSAALDSTTCRIMRARARFTPARDGNGQAAEDRYWDQIAWRLRPGS